MKKYIFVGLLVISFIISPSLVNAQPKPKDFDLLNQTPGACLQSCKVQMEENCATYPDSPLCPSDISRQCELNCQQTKFVFLNENFTLDIGKKITVSDYGNMEITLLAIKPEAKGLEKNSSGPTQFTADLKIKKDDGTKFISINSKEKKEVFGVRLDFVTYMAIASPTEDLKKSSVPEPFAGVFGVYEKGVGGFWSKVWDWIKGLF